MNRQMALALVGGFFVLAGFPAHSSTTGAPGTPNSAPDPCRQCQTPTKIELPDNRPHVTPPPPPNPNHDADVQRGIDRYRRPGS
jgi:hypothetical protein